MKREIPQKIDANLVSSGVSTLLRRTRSVSVLSFVITVSALGGLTTEQAANAAVSPIRLKTSTQQSVQLPDLIGSPRYKVSTFPTESTSKPSRLFQNKGVLVAAKPSPADQTSTLLTTQPGNMLALKTIVDSEASSKPQTADAGVSFTQNNLLVSSQLSSDELIAPLTAKNLLEIVDILNLDTTVGSLELSTSKLLDSVAEQVAEPILIAESPRQYLFNLDELLPQSGASDSGADLSAASILNPLDLSSTLEDSNQVLDSLEIQSTDAEVPAITPIDESQPLAVLPDIDLSQTIIPNDQNSALIDSGAIVHQVKPGETLDDISRLYQVSAKEISKANRISDPKSIGPKTKLRIPAHQSLSLSLSTVQDIVELNDTEIKNEERALVDNANPLDSAKAKAGQDNKEKARPISPGLSKPLALLPAQPPPSTKLNSDTPTTIATRNLLPQVPSLELPPLSSVDRYLPSQMLPGPQKYVWPAKGILTSGFGWRWGRPHRGIDIAAPVGTPVVAAAPGVVTTAGWNRWGYGNLVEIRHPDGSLTLYAHNHRIKTRVGQSVYQGQQIADMGSTGLSTGPHTHFELHPAGKGAINPVPLLRKL